MRLFDEPYTDMDWLFALIPLGVGAAVLYGLWSAPEPPADPENLNAFGCYKAEKAPAILLNEAGMQIFQNEFPLIPFHLERHTRGIALTADEPIAASRIEDSFHYSIDKRGIGRFLNFYKVINGSSYGVFNELELRNFHMLSDDGYYISYVKSDPSVCSGILVQPRA